MIFVTVGAQMPFDRMVQAVDDWAGKRGKNDIFAQIGSTEFWPEHIQWTRFLDPPEFRKKLQAASVVVAHAGMGSIITALGLGKPILVMPRLGELGETRNDHQVATAKRFLELGCVSVAFDKKEMAKKLDKINDIKNGKMIGSHASPELLSTLRQFINQDIPLYMSSKWWNFILRRTLKQMSVTQVDRN
ncbi:MAG: glycosyltransferase [Phycisphaerae bacterium]